MKVLNYLLLILIAVYLVNCAPLDSDKKDRKSRKKDRSEGRKNKQAKERNDGNKEEKLSNKEEKLSNKEEKLAKKFKNQLKPLFKLGCKPIKTKVPVRSLLDTKSHLHDLAHVYPEFVVIKKCNEACTFCKFPGDELGVESQVCIPSKNKSKSKKVIVKFRNEAENKWKYKTVKIKEDKKCECVSKDELTEKPPDEKNVNSRLELASNVSPLSIPKSR